MSSTTAFLTDGRRIEVPEGKVAEWSYEARNNTTHLGLADWYTSQGGGHQNMIEGTAQDGRMPIHIPNDQLGRIMLSFVCERPDEEADECSGTAWVDPTFFEEAGEPLCGCGNDMVVDTARIDPVVQWETPGLPLDLQSASEMADDNHRVTVRVSADIDEYLEAYAAGKTYGACNEYDMLHNLAFSDFGRTADEATVRGADANSLFIEYAVDLTALLVADTES